MLPFNRGSKYCFRIQTSISYEPKGMIIDKNSFKVEEIFNFGLQGRFSRGRAFVFFDELHSFKHFD